MSSESALRQQLATCTRILAMQGFIGIFGHVSAYDPESGKVFLSPGMGSDKATTSTGDISVIDLDGKVLEGEGNVPIEWPIHTALHASQPTARAVAHLHTPYATLFTMIDREFRPITLEGKSLFGDGIVHYEGAHLILTPEQGLRLAELLGDRRVLFLRNHGTVVAGPDLKQMLLATIILEDNAHKAIQASALGPIKTFGPEECEDRAPIAVWERRALKAWNYFALLEARWDRQPGTGYSTLA